MIRLHAAPGRLAVAIAIACVSLGGHTAAYAQSRDSIPIDSLRARAAAAWSDSRQDEALRLHEALVTRDSSPEPLLRLAALLARAGRLAESIAIYRGHVARHPTDLDARVALARTLSWATRHDEALAVYDSVSAGSPTLASAALGAAQTLAWAGRYDLAIGRYREWLAKNPGDAEARLALARTYSWAGRLREAHALYRDVAASPGGSRDAERGLARVTAWQGDFASSERQWRALVASDSADLESLTGLAQVLRWRGRPDEAHVVLRRALALDPDYGDARAQLPWVQAELQPSVAPVVDYLSDSDQNRVTTFTMAGTRPHVVTGVSVRGMLSHREAALGNGTGAGRARSTAARAGAVWRRPGSSAFLDAGVGIVRLSGDMAASGASLRVTRIQPTVTLTAGGRPAHAIGLSVSASRMPFDETALLISRGIGTEVITVDADAAITRRLAATASAEAARITGGSVANRRTGGTATLRRTINRRLSLAASARAFQYDTTVADGYFAPRAYRLAEGSARLSLGRELGWNALIDGGLGAQYLDFRGAESTRMVQRARATLTFRPAPGREAFATAGYANVAAPGQLERGEYRAVTLTVGGRLRR